MDIVTFAALAEPNRFRIVELLRESTRSVNEVAESLQMSQPQASRHLHALLNAGLVTVTPVAQQRIFALRPEPFHELTTWLASFESRWNDRFTQLDSYLKRLKEE
jgi:DNA-binding transcriptional ArsR family regulator